MPRFELPIRVEAGDGAPLVLTELAHGPRPAAARFAAVLLHGFAQNRSAYAEGPLPRALLAEGARVFLAELRGHGRSRPHDHRFDHGVSAHLEHDLPALLEAACVRADTSRVVLVGHSMGGLLGYAHLGREPKIAGLVTLGAPVILGHERPALRAAARLIAPVLAATPTASVRMDLFLRASWPLVSLPPGGPLREVFRLANPLESDRAALARVFDSAEPVSRRVFAELVELVKSGAPVLAGVDLIEALARSKVPAIAVAAGRDPFGSTAGFAPLLRGPARRELLEWPESGHVDLSMGRRAAEIAARVRDLAG